MEDGRLHGCEVVRPNWFDVYRRQILLVMSRGALNLDAAVAYVGAERLVDRERRGADARNLAQAAEHLLVDRNNILDADDCRVDMEEQNIVMVEAWIKVPEIGETAGQQSGADDKHQGNGHLKDDENFAEPVAIARTGGAARILRETAGGMDIGGAPRRNGAKHERR